MRADRASVNRLILWLLAITTAITLALHLPQLELFTHYSGLFLIYALLTGFAIYYGVVLSEGELSSAHVVGMVAFLSLPRTAQPIMIWAVALGGAAGGVL